MTIQIIIKGENKFKGKTISEFQDNLTSCGYPSEMGDRERDKVRWYEKKQGRRVRKEELKKLDEM
jgi:hypothetical protein